MYASVFLLPVESMCAWMRVLSQTHMYFKETRIQVNESGSAKLAVGSLEAEIIEAITITEYEQPKNMDEQLVAERFTKDYRKDGTHAWTISKSAVLKDIDGVDMSVANAAVGIMTNMLDNDTENQVTPHWLL